jgi:internalin A
VILVATHIDQPHSDYPAADLRARYPQIVDTIKVSSTRGDNIAELRLHIQKHAADLPLMGLRWPHTWLEGANAIRALCNAGHLHASRREVANAIKEHGLNDAESDVLMRWLHELGDILYFENVPEMRGRIILSPEWLTRHIGIVLRSDEVAAQHGILTRSHLHALWPDLDDHLQDHFLRLMDKFDLAYLIPDDPQDRSLIVERLPLNPPDYVAKWEEFAGRGNEISLRFKLDSMQPGIPTWFIARCHRFTMGIHWLNGVLFQDEGDRHRALIMADDRQNVVQMTARGPFPQRFMSLLRDGFRDTLKRYPGLEVDRWVPCPGYNELEERSCQNEFRLDSLEKWLESKPDRIFFHCSECDTNLSRLQLVEGIGAAALTQQLTEQRMAELLTEMHTQTRQEIKAHLDLRVEDVLKYQQRNFLRAFELEQQRELITCPNLFTIRPMPGRAGLLKQQEWHIQLYCQHPGAWHPIGEAYVIEEQREWFKKALPYLRTLLKVLTVVAPLAGAALAVTDVAGDKNQWAREQQKIFENEVKMMEKLLKGTETIVELERQSGERVRDLPERSTFHKHEGAELVTIRGLMDQLAKIDEKKGRSKWAGLTRRQTPEGDILWLDQEHLQEYLSKRPHVPQPDDLL